MRRPRLLLSLSKQRERRRQLDAAEAQRLRGAAPPARAEPPAPVDRPSTATADAGVSYRAPRVRCELCKALLTDLTLLEREIHVNRCLDLADEDARRVAQPPAPLVSAAPPSGGDAFTRLMAPRKERASTAAASGGASGGARNAFAVLMEPRAPARGAPPPSAAAGGRKRRRGGGGSGGGFFGEKQQHPKRCPVQKRVEGTRFLVDAFTYTDACGAPATRAQPLSFFASVAAPPPHTEAAAAAERDERAAVHLRSGSGEDAAWPVSESYQYLLTHFHADHYGGLTRAFERSAQRGSLVWCTAATAALVRLNLSVPSARIRVCPFDVAIPIPLPAASVRAGRRATMTLVDANHCPGAALALFTLWNATGRGPAQDPGRDGAPPPEARSILHTGDFRFHAAIHAAHPALAPFCAGRRAAGGAGARDDGARDDGARDALREAQPRRLATVHLDTTYSDPRYDFPSQRVAIDAAVAAARAELLGGAAARRPVPGRRRRGKGLGAPVARAAALRGGADNRALFLFGSYSLGKERLFLEVARALGVKLCVSAQKMRMLTAVAEADDQLGLRRAFALAPPAPAPPGGADRALPPRSSFLRSDLALLTCDPAATSFHVVGMGDLNVAACKERLAAWPRYSRVVAFRPTGWSFRPGGPGGRRASAATRARAPAVLTTRRSGAVTTIGVAYSEHSSFNELQSFMAHFAPMRSGVRVLPTVNCRYGSPEAEATRKELVGRLCAPRAATPGFFDRIK